MDAPAPSTPRRKKRAITLGGGGPAAGFLIGALAELQDEGLDFDVWALSCIGAWVGLVYRQWPDGDRAEQTRAFFETHAFRDTESYRGFPVNRAFAPDMQAVALAWARHALDPQTYVDVAASWREAPNVAQGWADFLLDPTRWFQASEVNGHLLNNVLAVHPMSRFLTSMGYVAGIEGLARVHYPESRFLADLKLPELDASGRRDLGALGRASLEALAPGLGAASEPASPQRPEIYHNAWRTADGNGAGRLQLFNNRWASYWQRGRTDYLPISRASLCACSALPYVLAPVTVPNDDDHAYTEGALIDTVNFRNLVEDHGDLDEIWVCRIVDKSQVRAPKNLHDALGNLCEQFAAEVGENDVSLFKHHLRKVGGRVPRVVEIELPADSAINYRWDRHNLAVGVADGRRAVRSVLRQDPGLRSAHTQMPRWS